MYLEKTLDDDAAAKVVGQLQAEQGVDKVNYLSRDEALGEFRNWSGFGGALDMLEENPLPAVAVVVPKIDFQTTDALNTLRDRVARIPTTFYLPREDVRNLKAENLDPACG